MNSLSSPILRRSSGEQREICYCDVPTAIHLEEIKRWLLFEKENFEDGFYCNWRQIAHSFDNNVLAVLLKNEIPIGFLTYRFCSDISITIEICEIPREYRRRGFGKLLINTFLINLVDQGMYTADLMSEPDSSKPFWRNMGFTEFPPLQVFNNHIGHFYKILINTASPLVSAKGEIISVWAHISPMQAQPEWVWQITRKGRESAEILPIIHPVDDQWEIEWKKEESVFYRGSIKRFKEKSIDYSNFLIISHLPLIP